MESVTVRRSRASKDGEFFGSIYHCVITLGQGEFNNISDLIGMVPDQHPDELEDADVMETMAWMLREYLNNMYGKYNRAAKTRGALDSVPSVSLQFHLSPEEQLQEIRDQVSLNRSVIESMADQASLKHRVRKVASRYEDRFAGKIERWSWRTLHTLACSQPTPGFHGYDYEELGVRETRVLMSPSFRSLERGGDSWDLDLPNYLGLMRHKVKIMRPLGELLSGRNAEDRFKVKICDALSQSNGVQEMSEIMKAVESGAPMGWVESILEGVR